MKQPALVARSSKSSACSIDMTTRNRTPRQRTRFAVCVDPGEYQVDLERWKIYQVLPDADAAKHGHLRVIDESGEDYLFPDRFFKPITLPPTIRRLFRANAVA